MRRSTRKRLWRLARRDAAALGQARGMRLAIEMATTPREPQTRRYGEMLLAELCRRPDLVPPADHEPRSPAEVLQDILRHVRETSAPFVDESRLRDLRIQIRKV